MTVVEPTRSRSPSDDPAASVGDLVDALPWNEVAGQSGPDALNHQRRAQLRAQILGDTPPPMMVGRFTVLHKLGEGGMGTVYAAYDDQLDRKVALKFLHPAQADSDHAIQRLLREAQALAKVSHPHLVAIYDVGRFEDQVYLAMELVPGLTMRAWAQPTRAWSEVLARWLEVGRALVAVHAAGMIHRDLKPDNVLIGEDGRARLVDFGLARGRENTATPAPKDDTASGGSRLDERLTQTHAIVGTPAYMAPEIRQGEPATEASDQYSLCLSISESLYGVRPRRPMHQWALVRVPEGSRVPAVLRRLLSRGLSMEPNERYPSTRALLIALERVLGRRRRRRVWGLAALALTVAASAGGALARSTAPEGVPSDPCEGVRDDLSGVWTEGRRTAVLDALTQPPLPEGPARAEALVTRLDAYAQDWTDARLRVCEATRVHHVQSDALFDRRIACFDGQRASLATLVDAALEGDPSSLPTLPLVLAELPSPEECEGASMAESRAPPLPPEQREAVTRVREAIAAAQVTSRIRGTTAVLGEGLRLREEAERLAHAPLHAEAELLVGQLYNLSDDPRALVHLGRAEDLAEALGDTLIKQEALRQQAELAMSVGTDRDADRRTWERLRATLRRMDDPPALLARAQRQHARLQLRDGDYDGAEATYREQIDTWAALGERHDPEQVLAWRLLAELLERRGRGEEAQQAFGRAAKLDADWGASTGTSARATRHGKAAFLQGRAALSGGRLDEAADLLQRSLEQTTRAYGAQTVSAARVHVALSTLARAAGRSDEALEHARTADQILRERLGDDHLLRASALSALGTAAFDRGEVDVVVECFTEALRLQQSILPADHPELAVHRSNLGEALVLAGRHDEAAGHLLAALGVMRDTLADDDDTLSYPLHALAEIALHRDRPDRACDYGQRALKLREHHRSDLVELARTRWLVARCLHTPAQRKRSRALAQQAREGFVGLGEQFTPQVAAIDAFLGP